MSAATGAEVGGIRAATVAKAAAVRKLVGDGVPIASIAAREGLSERRVYQLLSVPAARDTGSRDERGSEAQETVKVRRPLSKLAFAGRAWTATDGDVRLSSLPDVERCSWMKIVVKVHQFGKGGALYFGEADDPFESRGDFLEMIGASDESLARLIRRRVLVELEDGGIGLPEGMGLLPAEKKVSGAPIGPAELTPPAQRGAASRGPVAGQRGMLFPIAGGKAGGQTAAQLDRDTAVFSGENCSENFSANCTGANGGADENCTEGAIFGASRAAEGTTATTTQDIENPESSSGSSSNRARDENFRSDENFRADENFRSDEDCRSDENCTGAAPGQAVPAWVGLARELAAIVGLKRSLTMPEIEVARGWMTAGLGLEELRGIFHVVLTRDNRPVLPPLTYFAGAVEDALAVAGRVRGGSVASPVKDEAPAIVLSDADSALRDRLRATGQRFTPSLDDFREGAPLAGLARRWLETHEALARGGVANRVRVPEFTMARLARSRFEEDLLAAEDALTEPEPAAVWEERGKLLGRESEGG